MTFLLYANYNQYFKVFIFQFEKWSEFVHIYFTSNYKNKIMSMIWSYRENWFVQNIYFSVGSPLTMMITQ